MLGGVLRSPQGGVEVFRVSPTLWDFSKKKPDLQLEDRALNKNLAVSYSPTPSPVQYHRR